MKAAGRKIVGAVVYDYPMARAVDRAGVDLISVGDSVGTAVWGFTPGEEVTLDQMLLVCRAVSRAASHALVSCDFPYEASTGGAEVAVRAARRLVDESGAGMVKVDEEQVRGHLDLMVKTTVEQALNSFLEIEA